MPAELVSCPECQRKLRVPTDLIGKQVKCPTCGHTFTADPNTQAPPPPPAAVEEKQKPTRTSKVSRDEKDEDDDDEDRSRRGAPAPRRDDDEEDDDRPRRRRSRSSRDDDDDDDDRGRRRRDFVPHRGGAVLTMGILGLVLSFFQVVPVAGLVLAIMAWSMGSTDLAEMRAGRMDPEGEGQTNAGRVCGIVAVVLHILVIVVVGGIFFCMCLGGLGAALGRGRRSALSAGIRARYLPTSLRGGVMPEVVSCPKCQRKSRVPDTLVGKKVKCPGCAEIFTASVNGPAAPKKEAAAKKKPDDDDEDSGGYEVVGDKKKRRGDDDDDDDDRVSDKPRLPSPLRRRRRR